MKILFLVTALIGLLHCAGCASAPPPNAAAAQTEPGAARIARIRKMDAEIARTGSWQPLLDAMSDDVTLRATIPQGTPISGTFRGKAEVRRYFEVILPSVISRFEQHKPTELVASGDKMIVIGDDSMTLAEGGATHRSPYVAIYEYDASDRIRSMLIVQDLSGIAEHYRKR